VSSLRWLRGDGVELFDAGTNADATWQCAGMEWSGPREIGSGLAARAACQGKGRERAARVRLGQGTLG